MQFNANPRWPYGVGVWVGGPVCGSAGSEGRLDCAAAAPEIDRVVELQRVTLLTTMTTSGVGEDTDNATLAAC